MQKFRDFHFELFEIFLRDYMLLGVKYDWLSRRIFDSHCIKQSISIFKKNHKLHVVYS